MLAKYGISIGQFTEFIDVAFAGEKVSQVFEDNKSFDLVLRFNDENRGKIEAKGKGAVTMWFVEKTDLSSI